MEIITAPSLTDCCEAIAYRLIKDSANMNNGLFSGKAGCCIFLYEFGRYSGNDWYTDEADKLLTELCQSIDPRQGLSFSDGLFGIGWGLDMLQELEFIEVNEVQIMKYIDNLAASARFFNFGLPYGFLGHATYLLRRESKWQQNDAGTFDLYNKLFVVCDELHNLLHVHMTLANRYHILEMPKYLTTASATSLLHFVDEIATGIFLYTRLVQRKKYIGVIAHYLQQFARTGKILLQTFLSSHNSINALDKDPDGIAVRMVIFKLYNALQNMETATGYKANVNWDNLTYNLNFSLATFDCNKLALKHTFYVGQMLQLLKRNPLLAQETKQLRIDLLTFCNRIALADGNKREPDTGMAGISGIGLCVLAELTNIHAGYGEAWGI